MNNTTTNREIAERILHLRQEHNLSQASMAKLAGITPTNYGMKESGKHPFKLIEVTKLADHFHLTLEELVNGRHIEPLTYHDLGLTEEANEALKHFYHSHGEEAVNAAVKALLNPEILDLLNIYRKMAEYDGEYKPPEHIKKLDDGTYEVRMTKASLKKVIGTALISKLYECQKN